jgi:hypothetical protein
MATGNNIRFQDRTISKFKSQMIGGGARSNLFEVNFGDSPASNFNFPGDIGSVTSDDSMLIKSAALPASTIAEIPVPFRGRTLKIAGDRTFDVWTITVINDENFKWRNIFERWMNFITKVSDGSGSNVTTGPDGYQINAIVSQLSRGPVGALNVRGEQNDTAIKILRQYKLFGIFPTNVSQIDVSYNNENEIEEFSVDLQVQWFEAYDGSGSVNDNSIV